MCIRDRASEMLAGTATELSGIKIQDDYHFTIKLAYKFAPFIANLGMDYASCLLYTSRCV